jgi:hypothetical protein
MFKRGPHYDTDDQRFDAPAYTVHGWRGVAFYVLGWEVAPDEDTEWSGIEERTGRVVVVMVGDDHKYVIDEDDVQPIAREEYCGECGQIGCAHDGLDRTETEV